VLGEGHIPVGKEPAYINAEGRKSENKEKGRQMDTERNEDERVGRKKTCYKHFRLLEE